MSPITITPNASSTTYTAQLVVGDYLTGFMITGRASGELDLLAGKTIYIWAEDPNGIFGYWEPDISPLRVYGDGSFELGVGGSMEVQTAPAHYSGVAKIHAGLSNHGAEFEGSPIEVHYDIGVVAGLDPDRTEITVNRTFGVGDPTHVEVVDLGLPPQTEYWTAALAEPAPLDPFLFPTELQKGTDGTLTITLHTRAPGTYTETIHLTSQARGSHYNNFGYEMDLRVTQIVAPNDSVLAVFEPPEITQTRRAGDPTRLSRYFTVIPNTDVSVGAMEMEPLSHPPEADGNPLADQWWTKYLSEWGSLVCEWSGETQVCLPPGLYTGRLRCSVTKEGVTSAVYQPITLTLEL